MRRHWGPGPVFVFESLIAARRWQYYGARVFFVLVLLLALGTVWISHDFGSLAELQAKQLTLLGRRFFESIAGIQIMMVLLVAPAATAGAICLDRARGTLTHVFVTDLDNTEIVLGKLGSRLLPVFALVATAAPVMAIATLLGGIIPEVIGILFVVSLALAFLSSSLALLVSARVKKTHEVLMSVYAIILVGLLSYPMWLMMVRAYGLIYPPSWFAKLNPFVLVYAPYESPSFVEMEDVAIFLAGAFGLAVVFNLVSILTLRKEPRESGRLAMGWERWVVRVYKRLFSWWPTPSLDFNPVLWREWHRNRPSRTAWRLWAIFILGAIAASGMGLYETLTNGARMGPLISLLANSFQVTISLLFLSVIAPNALGEERVRGSLDVLMSTPLSTASIVLGKWWGIFRIVPLLAILPAIGSIALAIVVIDPSVGVVPGGPMRAVTPLTLFDRVMGGGLPILWIFAHGASITSVGLAMSTWFSKPSRAIALSVAYYIGLTVGSVVGTVIIIQPLVRYFGPYQSVRTLENSLISISPFVGQITTLETIIQPWNTNRAETWAIQLTVILLECAFAGALLAATVLTFNRCLGRVEELSMSEYPSLSTRRQRKKALEVELTEV